ncbi:MAG: glycosyltransferase family 2 protein [Candidatus Buchananbacteria bacterium]|nr:glycosyltransferase family 2 protein [Candidatus Buchananbacteria bacterium]
MPTLSIVIPVYNEKKYIAEILNKVDRLEITGLDKEVVIVDDGSTDGTIDLLKMINRPNWRVIFSEHNQGKGAALRQGFKHTTGDIVAIQDADLEYSPPDLEPLVQAIVRGQAKVAYGSRMISKNPVGHLSYYLGNKLISWLAQVLYRAQITDVETCYKVFSGPLLRQLSLRQNDFGFEVEVTAKVLRQGIKILELPISYRPRQFNEGKKISWIDGCKALWLLIVYRFNYHD